MYYCAVYDPGVAVPLRPQELGKGPVLLGVLPTLRTALLEVPNMHILKQM